MKKIFIVALLVFAGSAQALNTNDLLAAIGMPLAVAAVADITGVPQDQLAELVTALNGANTPVAEEVHIIQYVPVALVQTSDDRTFLQFVQQQISQGVTGVQLVPVVTQQLQTYYPASTQIVVSAPAQQTFVVQEPYVPQVVVTRVTEVRTHPHGGAPGQLKKQLGLKTGAQVVHGVAAPPPMASSTPVEVKVHGKGHKEKVVVTQPVVVGTPAPVVIATPHGHGHGPDGNGPPGQQKDKGDKGGKGHGKKG